MCQGKILGKPLPEKVVAQQPLGLSGQQGLSLGCLGRGQQRTLIPHCTGLCKVWKTWMSLALCLRSPVW